jgi:tetratricopeptide (TPR) repeat protein
MAADWARGIEYRRAALAGVSAVVLCGLLVAACHQAAYWHDSESLWTHTIEYTRDNAVPHNNLGNVLAQQGRTDEAITQYREALRIKPDYAYAHSNLGNALLQQGRTDEAITQNREALRIKPDDVHACNNLGDALLQQGRTDEAITEYRQALQIKPDEVNAHNKLGNALLQQGKRDEAISQYREVLQINPALAEAQYNLGFALLQEGRTDEALVHLQKALELRPDNPTIQCSLAWALATAPQSTIRDGTRALELASKANQSTGGANLQILRTLAAAYAETGDFANAVQTAQRALQLAVAQSNTQVSEALRREIKLYEAGHRFEEAH